MIRAKINIPKYGWTVYAYFAVDDYYTYEILDKMRQIGAPRSSLLRAHKNLIAGELDSGLCYGNRDNKKAVFVTSIASDGGEFFNSVVHELRHLQQYIADEVGIVEYGEEPCYLIGEIARSMYPYCRELLCDCCREKKGRGRC